MVEQGLEESTEKPLTIRGYCTRGCAEQAMGVIRGEFPGIEITTFFIPGENSTANDAPKPRDRVLIQVTFPNGEEITDTPKFFRRWFEATQGNSLQDSEEEDN